jgi:hypothetical protein
MRRLANAKYRSPIRWEVFQALLLFGADSGSWPRWNFGPQPSKAQFSGATELPAVALRRLWSHAQRVFRFSGVTSRRRVPGAQGGHRTAKIVWTDSRAGRHLRNDQVSPVIFAADCYNAHRAVQPATVAALLPRPTARASDTWCSSVVVRMDRVDGDGFALRLGFRQVRGLSTDGAEIVAARAANPSNPSTISGAGPMCRSPPQLA